MRRCGGGRRDGSVATMRDEMRRDAVRVSDAVRLPLSALAKDVCDYDAIRAWLVASFCVSRVSVAAI